VFDLVTSINLTRIPIFAGEKNLRHTSLALVLFWGVPPLLYAVVELLEFLEQVLLVPPHMELFTMKYRLIKFQI
jgi:hypothetical protein